jgi:hypothetical protein
MLQRQDADIRDGNMRGRPVRAHAVVQPTYDREHYLARARRYGREATHEPDVVIRDCLQKTECECRRKADELQAA